MSPPSRTLYRVKWYDAHSPRATDMVDMDNPVALDDIHKPAVMETVGWILRTNEAGITMAAENAGDNQFRSVTFILRCMVISEEPWKQPRKKRVGTAASAKAPSPLSPVVESSTASVSAAPIDGDRLSLHSNEPISRTPSK